MTQKYVQEDLRTTTGSEGTLLVSRKIYDVLWPAVEKALLPRELAAVVFTGAQIPGSSIDINRVTPDTMVARTIAEGAEITLDDPEFTTTNIKPVKYGLAVKITREMIEDSAFNLLQTSIELAGRELAENENSLVITALDGAANTVTGGAAVTIANITRAVQYLENADFRGSDFVVGNEVANDLRNIDTFFDAAKSGGNNAVSNYFIGSVYGMKVWLTTSGTGAGITATSSYVIDRAHAYAIVEKRGVTVEQFDLPTHDTQGVAVTQRIAVAAIRTSAIAKITST